MNETNFTKHCNQILRRMYEKQIRETEELILNYQNKRDELQSEASAMRLREWRNNRLLYKLNKI